ncbi:putative quinol monooxygenase [Anaeromyxobacter paludicola]|uniref:ABM domain-containing protein n=1 Tax=Anaeromyxobacter paludicola TaxID=2918171 RepID=A0ABM7XDK2_9BACT|nr:putative quinol monooxygenase [Anaeromyxobacter paludicola]BDG09956.1 hypothetical protein AMPC_30690 [Anaeromyxobacter paludicola]
MVVLHAHLTLAPGARARFEALLAPLVPASRAEPGCLSYAAYRSLEAEDEVVFVEEWESWDVLQAHFGTPHFRAYDGAVGALLAAPKRVRVYEVASHRDL